MWLRAPRATSWFGSYRSHETARYEQYLVLKCDLSLIGKWNIVVNCPTTGRKVSTEALPRHRSRWTSHWKQVSPPPFSLLPSLGKGEGGECENRLNRREDTQQVAGNIGNQKMGINIQKLQRKIFSPLFSFLTISLSHSFLTKPFLPFLSFFFSFFPSTFCLLPPHPLDPHLLAGLHSGSDYSTDWSRLPKFKSHPVLRMVFNASCFSCPVCK